MPAPVLDQHFVVGSGFAPIPAKLVAQISAGKYVDLSDIMAANLVQIKAEPQLLLDERVILTSGTKRRWRQTVGIFRWVEAFTLFAMVLTSFCTHCWRDLAAYELLILRTYRQFAGRVWLTYHQAFREHAAAIKLTDWSSINVQLYNSHAVGASAHSSSGTVFPQSMEAVGPPAAMIVCKSWNRGQCSLPYYACKYSHRCSNCAGNHRASACPGYFRG